MIKYVRVKFLQDFPKFVISFPHKRAVVEVGAYSEGEVAMLPYEYAELLVNKKRAIFLEDDTNGARST